MQMLRSVLLSESVAVSCAAAAHHLLEWRTPPPARLPPPKWCFNASSSRGLQWAVQNGLGTAFGSKLAAIAGGHCDAMP